MTRMDRALAAMHAQDIDGYLVFSPVNMGYLCGFSSKDCYVLISDRVKALVTDTRYTELAETSLASTPFKVVPWRTPHPPFEEAILSLCTEGKISRLGFESDRMPFAIYARLAPLAQKSGVALVPIGGFDQHLKVENSLVESLRYQRDEEEMAYIKRACDISCQGLERTLERFKHGMLVSEFARTLSEEMKQLGADAHGGIVAWPLSGPVSSMPHGSSSDFPILEDSFLLIDFGASYRGYSCDMTRTFVVGKANAKQRRIHQTVVQAQQAGMGQLFTGNEAWKVDDAARKVILESEFAEYVFTYGAAHGVGLEVHEQPFCFAGNRQALACGNTISIEPGIYIPGEGGFRLEDVVVIGPSGPEYLTHFSRDLIEL